MISIPKVNYDRPSSFGSLELRHSETNEDIGQPVSYDSNSTYQAPLLLLDSLELPRVDFIKIDVEGMELEVLQGAMSTLKRCKPMMLIEPIKTKKRDLDPILKRAGYKRFVLGMNLLTVHQDDKIEISVQR